MNIMRSIKFLFLIAISTLFCYRAALLHNRENLLAEHEMALQVLNLSEQDEIIDVYHRATISDAIVKKQQMATNPKAGVTEQMNTKLNNQLKHHGYMIKQMLEKGTHNESDLKKIEKEIAIIEAAAQKLGILRLIDHALITDIKKSIAYLRMQTQSQNKRASI